MKSILIIEDDPLLQDMLQLLFRGSGYATLAASDGGQGLELFGRQPVDLVITDIFMPDHDGFEVIKTLKAKNPEVKIIAISGGFLARSDKEGALADVLGVLRTFSKPFDARELLGFVDQVVQDGSGKADRASA